MAMLQAVMLTDTNPRCVVIIEVMLIHTYRDVCWVRFEEEKNAV